MVLFIQINSLFDKWLLLRSVCYYHAFFFFFGSCVVTFKNHHTAFKHCYHITQKAASINTHYCG